MTDQREEMEKLGFKLSGSVYVCGNIAVRRNFSPYRPWTAAKGTETLNAHGDTFNGGRLRKFASAVAAAKAALERWS